VLLVLSHSGVSSDTSRASIFIARREGHREREREREREPSLAPPPEETRRGGSSQRVPVLAKVTVPREKGTKPRAKSQGLGECMRAPMKNPGGRSRARPAFRRSRSSGELGPKRRGRSPSSIGFEQKGEDSPPRESTGRAGDAPLRREPERERERERKRDGFHVVAGRNEGADTLALALEGGAKGEKRYTISITGFPLVRASAPIVSFSRGPALHSRGFARPRVGSE
jgi:hypothetical protein